MPAKREQIEELLIEGRKSPAEIAVAIGIYQESPGTQKAQCYRRPYRSRCRRKNRIRRQPGKDLEEEQITEAISAVVSASETNVGKSTDAAERKVRELRTLRARSKLRSQEEEAPLIFCFWGRITY
jgi:hypothetical protein